MGVVFWLFFFLGGGRVAKTENTMTELRSQLELVEDELSRALVEVQVARPIGSANHGPTLVTGQH